MLRRDLSHDEPTIAGIAIVEEESSSELTPIEISWSPKKHHDTRPKSQTKDLSLLG